MRQNLCSLIALSLAFVLQISNASSKHLAERPSYLTPCDFNDANLNACFARGLQVLFHEWSSGVPGLKSLTPLDPLHVKRARIQQNGGETININADLENVVIHGAREIIIKNAVLNKNNFQVDATVELPVLSGTASYKIQGSVLGLPLNGQGTGSLEATNVRLQFQIILKLRDEGDLTFAEIVAFKAKIVHVDGFHIHLDNLFGGQKELEDSANDLFNQNWRELLAILSPALEQTIELVLKDRFTKIYNYVPANYFIANIPKNANFYG